MPNEPRAVDVTVDIAAPADAVWNALTDPTELVRWFPFQAAVTPGVGGTVKWSWDDLDVGIHDRPLGAGAPVATRPGGSASV